MLLLFNDQTSFSVQQLTDYTGIEQEYMLLLLEPLIKLKLLMLTGEAKDKVQGKISLCETSMVEINAAYNGYVSLVHIRKKLLIKFVHCHLYVSCIGQRFEWI